MKKFIIAMLCVAILFGFAACDNSSSTPSTPDMSNIAYVEGSLRNASSFYFEKDTPSAADFIFTGYDVEGNVVAADMAAALFESGSVDASKDTVTFKYHGTDVKIVDVPVYTIDAIGVETVKTQDYFVNSNIEKIKDNFKVTVYALEDADDPESTVVASKVLAADKYTIAYTEGYVDKQGDEATKFTKAGDVVLTFTADGTTNVPAYGDPADDNDKVELAVMADYLVSFTVAQNEDVPAVIGDTIGDADDYVEVTYTMASGLVGDAATTNATATPSWKTSFASNAKFDEKTSYVIEVTAEIEGEDEVQEVTLKLSENTLVSFEVKYKDGSTKIENGTTIKLEDFTISKLTWLGTTAPEDAPSEADLKNNLQMKVNGSVATSYEVKNYGNDQKLPITFSLTGDYADAECETVLKVTVTGAVEPASKKFATEITSPITIGSGVSDWADVTDKDNLKVYADDTKETELNYSTDYTVEIQADRIVITGAGTYTDYEPVEIKFGENLSKAE